MENKINLLELLKDCPSGMELDCTMFDNVKFDYVDTNHQYPIRITVGEVRHESLTEYGEWNYCDTAKCVIFPKGKTTWKGFHRPFKDGDILVGKSGYPFIFKSFNNIDGCYSYCGIDSVKNFKLESHDWTFADSLRFATEEEKKILFQAIKDKGYEWNAETKTLVKLVEPKFDITTLKPFDKVLVRDNDEQLWTVDLFGFHGKTPYTFMCVGHYTKQCIPYEGNEHLLGTNDDCDEFYKTWEK